MQMSPSAVTASHLFISVFIIVDTVLSVSKNVWNNIILKILWFTG